MTERRVLLDSCVMFPMYLRDTLLCAAEAGLYLPYWSQKILDDTLRNLVSTGRVSSEKALRLEMTIKEAFPEAMVEVPMGLSEVMTNHPDDRHVLAAAVIAKADVLVTSNLRHFKPQNLALWNIESKSPDDFLSDLYDLYSDEMMQVIWRQSSALKKPSMTIADLLNLLSEKAGVPKFVSKLRDHKNSGDV